MRARYILGVLVLAVLVLTSVNVDRGSSSGDEWVCAGQDDDDVGADQLAQFLRGHNVDVLFVREGLVGMRRSVRIGLQPRLTRNGIDRLVVRISVSGRAQYRGSDEIIRFANSLNRNWNVGCFYVDDSGDIVLRNHITFIDALSWQEFDEYIDWMESSLAAVHADRRADFERYCE